MSDWQDRVDAVWSAAGDLGDSEVIRRIDALAGERPPGDPLAAFGKMSLTIFVPALVPSLFHSSLPWVGSYAEKYAVDPMAANPPGCELSVPGKMSLTSLVPAEVPSVFHSSQPCASSWAVK